jgi:hypothetical protein
MNLQKLLMVHAIVAASSGVGFGQLNLGLRKVGRIENPEAVKKALTKREKKAAKRAAQAAKLEATKHYRIGGSVTCNFGGDNPGFIELKITNHEN